MSQTIMFGLFDEPNNADNTVIELENKGFTSNDISVITKDSPDRIKKIEHSKAAPVADAAVSGATVVGAIGGLTGLLAGLGVLTIPGLGAILIGGPLAAALGLTGAAATAVSGAATGALAGGLVGALGQLGLPDDQAQIYEDRLKSGSILIAATIKDENDVNDVQHVFNKNHADQIYRHNVVDSHTESDTVAVI